MNRFFYENNFRFRLIRHLLFFLITVIIFAAIFHLQNSSGNFPNTLWITFINSLFFFCYAYITIFLLIPEFLLAQKIIWFILLFILIGIALSALKLVVSDHIFYSSIAPENIESSGLVSLRFIVVNTKDMTFIVALFCIAKYVKDYLYAENFRKKLEVQNKAAQAKLIQSQFDPHFLFNTINNLYALSLLNPLKTLEIIERIKTVLKYIIEEIQGDYVDLNDEIILVKNYIQLEKLRYGKRLDVTFSKVEILKSIKIAPMVLFFLVENCFKHGSSLDAGTPWIKISVKREKGNILMSTENSKPQTFANEIGTENKKYQLVELRRRLEIIYSNDGYHLKVENNEKTFKVELKLKEKIETHKNIYR